MWVIWCLKWRRGVGGGKLKPTESDTPYEYLVSELNGNVEQSAGVRTGRYQEEKPQLILLIVFLWVRFLRWTVRSQKTGARHFLTTLHPPISGCDENLQSALDACRMNEWIKNESNYSIGKKEP